MQPALTPQVPPARVRAHPSSHRFAPRALNMAQEVGAHLSLLLLPLNVLSLTKSHTPCTRHGMLPEYSGCLHPNWSIKRGLDSKWPMSSPQIIATLVQAE